MRTRLFLSLGLVVVLAAGVGFSVWKSGERDVTTSSAAAYSQYEHGLAEARRVRADQAAVHFQRAIELDPSFAMAYLQLWMVGVGSTQELEGYLAQAMAHRAEVSNRERLQIEFLDAAHREESETMESVFDQLVREYPDDPFTLSMRGQKAALALDYDTALLAYERILENDPERVDVHDHLGSIYLQAGRYDEAITSLKRYSFFAPDLPNAHDSLGDAFRLTGRYDEAIAEYSKALETDPTFAASAFQLVDVLCITGQLSQARRTLDTTRDMVASMPRWKGRFEVRELQVLAAARQWQELVKGSDAFIAEVEAEYPGKPHYGLSFHFMKAWAQLELDEPAAADQSAKTALNLANDFLDRNPYIQTLAEELSLAKALLQSHFGRQRGQPKSGIGRLRKAIANSALGPHELIEYRNELALACFEAGDMEAAIEHTSRTLADIPTQPDALLLLSRTLAVLGREDAARDGVRRYLEVMRHADLDYPDLIEARALLRSLNTAS